MNRTPATHNVLFPGSAFALGLILVTSLRVEAVTKQALNGLRRSWGFCELLHPASLDDIAKDAGVGAGTLYLHFPTRDALIEAVYRTEVEKLAAAERKFTEAMLPIEALRAWMLLFVDYIATKQIIAPALNTFVGGPSKLYEGSRAQIQGAIDGLVKRAIKSGDIRKDLDPFDLLRALIGVSNVASSPDWQQSAKRLVDILITGSRPVK